MFKCIKALFKAVKLNTKRQFCAHDNYLGPIPIEVNGGFYHPLIC